MSAAILTNGRRSTFKQIDELSKRLLKKSAIAQFTDKGKDSKVVAGLIERLREAIVYYQVSDYSPSAPVVVDKGQISQQQAIYHQIAHLTVRLCHLVRGADGD